jgi:hypothetical protein
MVLDAGRTWLASLGSVFFFQAVKVLFICVKIKIKTSHWF